MKQPMTLFDLPRARKSDPDTSHTAAEGAKKSGLIGKQARWVMDMLKTQNGSTYRELAAAMGLANPNVCARRLPELRTRGLVVNGENRVCSIAGNLMQTWWAAGTFGPELKRIADLM